MPVQTDSVSSSARWTELDLFPLRIERAVVARWYWLLGLPVAVWLATGAYMAGRPNPWGGKFDIAWFVSNPYVLILVAGLFCTGVFFAPWERQIRCLTPTLVRRGVLSRDTPEETYSTEDQLATDFGDWLRSPWRYVVIVAFLAFTIASSLAFDMQHVLLRWSNWARSTQEADYLVVVFLACQIATFLLWSYGAGSAAWCLLSSARLVRELPRRFKLSILWGHPDNCGGFREVGLCCLGMATPFIIGGAVLGLWLLLPDIGSVMYIITCIALVGFVVPLTVLVFVGPLWAVHCAMATCRQAYKEMYSARHDYMLRRLDHDIGKVDETALKQLTLEISAYQLLSPEAVKFPAWPFDWRILTKFALPQAAAMFAAAAKLVALFH